MAFKLSRSATHSIHEIASGLIHHHKSRQEPCSQEDHDKEKAFVAQFAERRNTLPPEEVQQDPRNKDLGRQSRGLNVKDFELVRTLGTGTFARVWLVRLAKPAEEDREKVFALKVLRKVDVIKLKQVDHVNHERSVLADVAGHPFITTLITTFSDHESLYMLLDYCPGGEVFSYLRKAKRFDENTSRFYAAEIVLILEFLHEREGVAYRDLKPENLLLDAEGHIKLVDFGFAKRLGNRETYTLCGTPEYLAPEVIQSKGHTTAVDWWALGILIFEFLTGYPPFWDQNPMEIYKKIVTKEVRFPSDPVISPNAQSIIRAFCVVDRSKRLGNISGGAQRVKDHPFFEGINWEDVYYRKEKGPIIPPVRYPGDAQCFDLYPDEESSRERYNDEMAKKWDGHFRDF
ncbi:related to cAMP-dependent protein kinase catalytic subunit [Rhynchosporium agropyri]|uniref:cAMP-dependent protein kinase n=2 Tax=Rhynchosporium TaxID=38037 RepID=A0A1E1LGK4_9HELO|nr:related to cAMP-dependent protein kinase catalytic subunit [Rhynchosporium commune]CZT08869.1 related to cAMP-dependent protein kinase catalytic subunit [Rhynchosporium agropyri]